MIVSPFLFALLNCHPYLNVVLILCNISLHSSFTFYSFMT